MPSQILLSVGHSGNEIVRMLDPTETRIVRSVIPAARRASSVIDACDIVSGYSTSDSTPPAIPPAGTPAGC